MRLFILAGAMLAVALAAPAAATSAADPAGGTWIVKGKVASHAFTQTCRFDRQGEALSGTCYDAAGGAHKLTAGAVSDGRVNWTIRTHFLLASFDVTFSGVVDGDVMTGQVGAYGHAGVFTATRS